MKSKLLGASLLAIGAALASSNAYAADAAATDTAAVADSSAVGELIVTGTRQTGVKAEDSAAPIQVVGGTALAHVGQPDVIQALAQNLPSFNAEATGGDTANLTLAAALRGLNPNDTLVLVNGKRRHPTGNLHVDPSSFQGAATPDLSLIPVSAIDHIEVLQDGAAAQYGTDAIAGVINIILKDKDHGGLLTATGGQYYFGDGTTGAGAFNIGLPLTAKGYLNLSGEVRFHDFSRRGGADRRVFNLDGSIKATDNAIDKAGLPGAPNSPLVNNINGDAQSLVYNGFYNAGYHITDDIELYSYGSYSHRTASSYENYRVPSKVTRTVGGVTTVPFPNGFEPREALVEDDFAWTGGIKGTVALARFVICGVMLRRTKRRSAETTGVTWRFTPKGTGWFCGWKKIWAPACWSCTPSRKNCWSWTLMLAVWPLKTVIFGACMTWVRRSPAAASMNMKTWMSLRKARPSDRPPSAPSVPGKPPNGGTEKSKLDDFKGMFRSGVSVPAGVRPETRPRRSKFRLTKPNGVKFEVRRSGSRRAVLVRMLTSKSTPSRSKNASETLTSFSSMATSRSCRRRRAWSRLSTSSCTSADWLMTRAMPSG